MRAPRNTSAAAFVILLMSLFATDRSYAQCTPKTLAVNPISVGPLMHDGRGDKEMAGHNPLIEIWSEAVATPNSIAPNLFHHVTISGFVRMTEETPDFSTFSRNFSQSIYVNVPVGCALIGVDRVTGLVVGHGGQDNHEPTSYPGRGLISNAVCVSDTQGSDEGKLSCEITFNNIVAQIVNADFSVTVEGAGELQTTCGVRFMPVPPVTAWPLPHLSGEGDTEMAGHNPSITIDTAIGMDIDPGFQTAAKLSSTVQMKEDQPDGTTFQLTRTQRFVSLLASEFPGCGIRSVGVAEARITRSGGNSNHRWTEHEIGGDSLHVAVCLSDTRGDDRDRLGCKIYLRPIQVVLVRK
jgi:hypothetical protein